MTAVPRKSARARAPGKQLQEAILDAAERLFGRHGPDGVSLRQIAAAAGSSNHFAVQYHFADKENLIRAVFERRLRSLEEKRGVLLADVTTRGLQGDTRAMLEVLLRPIADERDAEGRRSYAAFLLGVRVFSALSEAWWTVADAAPLTRHVSGLLRGSVRDLSEQVYNDRLAGAVTVFLAAVADWDRREAADPSLAGSEEAHFQNALDFAVGGMLAPLRGPQAEVN